MRPYWPPQNIEIQASVESLYYASGTLTQTLTVRVADADLARHLSMDIGMPVVRVIRLIMNRANQLVYAAQVFYPAKYLSIQTELTPGF